jgi:hypothetical protein
VNAPEYAVDCMGMPCGRVDAAEAARLFVANEGCDGDLETGYSYWVPGEHVKRLVRVDVRPIIAET